MHKNKIILASLGTIFSLSLHAGVMGLPQASHHVVMLSLGPAWAKPGETQTLNFLPNFPQTYVADKGQTAFGAGELFLGLEHSVTSLLRAQYGLAFAATTSVSLKGNIWQDSDPDFDNYTYSYKISHSQVAIKGKLLQDVHQIAEPYIGASIGVGFNHAYHYLDTPKIWEVISAPPFASHTTTAFTYALDIGIQKTLNTNWSIGMGYEFADWGKSHLGPASDEASLSGLSIHHLYTNELQLNITFVA